MKEQIAESIKKIEKFPLGYPKFIATGNPKWDAFFEWEYNLCREREKELGIHRLF